MSRGSPVPPRSPDRPIPRIPPNNPATTTSPVQTDPNPQGPCAAGGWFTLGYSSKAACKATGGAPIPPPPSQTQPAPVYVCSDGTHVADPSKCPTIPPPKNPVFDLCSLLPGLCTSGATGGQPPTAPTAPCPGGGARLSDGTCPAELGPPTVPTGPTAPGTDPLTTVFGSLIQSLLSGGASAGGGTGSVAPAPPPAGVTVIPPTPSSGVASSPLLLIAALVTLAGGGYFVYKNRHKLFKGKE